MSNNSSTPIFKSPTDVLSYTVSQLEQMSADYRMAALISDAVGVSGDNISVIIAGADLKHKEGITNMLTNPSAQVKHIDATRKILNELIADLRAHEVLTMTKGMGKKDA